MAHRVLAFAFFASATGSVHTEADSPPASGIRCVEYEGFPHAEEAGAPISSDERMAFVRKRDRLAIALETALKAWVGRLKRPADACKIAQIFYESGDDPHASFRKLQEFSEFRRFFVTEELEALSELRPKDALRLTLVGTSAWSELHSRFVFGEGNLAEVARKRGFAPRA